MLAAVALLTLACGARSPLEDDSRLPRDVSEPETGAGGGGSGGSGGSATGMPSLPPCPSVPPGSTGAGWKGPVEVLASGQVGLYNLAIDDEHVYFTARGVALAEGEVRRVPKSGGAVTVVAAGLHNPTEVLVDGTHVTWLEASVNGGVRRIPKVSGAVMTLTTHAAYRLEQDDDHVYYADLESMTIGKVPKTGGPVTTLASMQEGPQQVAVGPDYVCWANYPSGNVRRVAKSGGAVASVSAKGGGLERGVVVDCHGVFWVEGTTLRWRASGGGAEVIVANVPPGEAFLSLDATHVYLAREAPIRVSRTEGKVEAFPQGSATMYGPTVRLDATHAYWVDAAKGTVNRIAK